MQSTAPIPNEQAESKQREIEALDAIFNDVALYDMEHGEITARDRKWADALRARTRERIAELRRNLTGECSHRRTGPPARWAALRNKRSS